MIDASQSALRIPQGLRNRVHKLIDYGRIGFWLITTIFVAIPVPGTRGAIAQQVRAQDRQEAVKLTPEKPVQNQLSGRNPQVFEIDVASGQFVQVVVTCHDADLEATFLGPDGRALRVVTNLTSVEQEATIDWLVDVEGTYRLEIRLLVPTAKAVTYLTKLAQLRSGSVKDKNLIAGEIAYEAAEKILQGRTPDRLDLAFQKLGEAVGFAQRAEDFGMVARAKRRQAVVSMMQGDLDRARVLAMEARQLVESKFGLDDLKLAPALWDIADVEAGLESSRWQGPVRSVKARELYEQGLNIIKKHGGTDWILSATGLSRMTNILVTQGDYRAALETSEQASRIYVARYGPDSVQAANSYVLIATTLQRVDRLPDSLKLLERGLQIYETHFGANSPALLVPINVLVRVLVDADQFPEALAKTERALQIITATEGVVSRAAINGLLEVSRVLIVKGDLEAARPRLDQAIKIAEELDGEGTPGIAVLLMEKLKSYPRLEDYEAGRETCDQAIKISRQTGSGFLGTALIDCARFDLKHGKKDEGRAKYEEAIRVFDGPDAVSSMRAIKARQELSESFIKERQDKSNRAINGLREVVKALEGIYGLNHPALIDPLESLARAFTYKELQKETAEVIRRSAKILKDNKLEEEPIAITTLSRVAFLQSSEHEPDAAKETLRQILKIYEKNSGRRVGADEMLSRNNLAELLITTGDLAEARVLLDETISLGKRHLGARSAGLLSAYIYMAKLLIMQGDPEAAASLVVNMRADYQNVVASRDDETLVFLVAAAGIAAQVGKPAEAREFAEKAVSLAERELGPEHFLTARILATQAATLMAIGDESGAEEAATKAEAVFSRTNSEHFTRALALGLKGELLIQRTRSTEGRALIEQAVQILSRELGAENYLTSAGIGRLGWLSYDQGQISRAQELFLKSAFASGQHIQDVLPMLSLAEQRLFLELRIPEQISGMLTACREGPSFRQAYDLMFRWKGSLVNSLRRQSVLNRQGRSGPSAANIKRLTQLRGEISAWYQQITSIKTESWRVKNAELTLEKENLERTLERTLKSDVVVDPLADGLKGFQTNLQKDEAFLDFYLYDFRQPDGAVEERYAVILTGAAGDPLLIDVGSSKPINNAVGAWRENVLVKSNPRKQWDVLADLLWKPLAGALPAGVRKVWVSPDGELARIPWQLLPATNPKRASLMLTQADSARELARLRRTGSVPGTPQSKLVLLVGDIDFDAKVSSNDQLSPDKRLSEVAGSPEEIRFIRAIGEKFGARMTMRTRAGANKGNVVDCMQKANYVHLATHGFFAQANPEQESREEKRFTMLFEQSTAPNIRNPLVESGIALAGANVIDPVTSNRRGLLSAEEILDLDLTGCELVTLSACDTGRGREVTAQGVMGLRAAIIATGSRSMLMSLWRVPDEATVKFMRTFYTNLWLKRMAKSEALLKAQETIRDDPSGRYREPVYWAGWVLVGEGW